MYVPLGLIAIAILAVLFLVRYAVHRHHREKQELCDHVKKLQQESADKDNADVDYKEALLHEGLTDKETRKE